ncbi:NAD-dependent protein deacetylase [compost metagenome]
MDLINLIKRSRRVVVLTGAGMSTESGLKDFRSNGGLWAGKDPMEIASTKTIRPKQAEETVTQYENRINDFVDFYTWRIKEVQQHEPNEGHRILAKWQKDRYIREIITQNVDGYHQKAGSTDVIELHGNITELHCDNCKAKYSSNRYTHKPSDDLCDHCGGLIRPNIVLFGEPLGPSINQANKAAREAHLLLVIGTSLQVAPANWLPIETIQNGGAFAIINREPTELDAHANCVVNGEIGQILQYIDSQLYPS